MGIYQSNDSADTGAIIRTIAFLKCKYHTGTNSKRSKKHGDKMKIKIKRVYEEPAKKDGMRILVDRLWPRGLTKQKASIDLWLKDIAPSTELRKWFDHDPEKWKEFRKRYHEELQKNTSQIEVLEKEMKKGTVTLVYGAKDKEHNEALVLKELINRE
jgi:uncharacterized protein YeaO (DUF488 family)